MNELAVNWKWAIQGYRGLPLSLSLSSPLHIVSPSCCSLLSPASPLACSFTFTRFYFPLSVSPSSSISFLSSYLVAVHASFVTRAPASPSFFSLSPLSFLRQSLLPFLCARNARSKRYFRRKIPRQQRETFHFEWFLPTGASYSFSLCSTPAFRSSP